MHNLANITLAQLAAERQRADDAGREQAVDVLSVLYAVEVKIAEGRIEEAKAIVAAYRAEQVQG